MPVEPSCEERRGETFVDIVYVEVDRPGDHLLTIRVELDGGGDHVLDLVSGDDMPSEQVRTLVLKAAAELRALARRLP